MFKNYFFLLIIACTIAKTYSIQCYTCEGTLSKLDNKTCSVTSRNDSCYATLGFLEDDGDWLITMDGFNATSDFPSFYKKPKSGSSFIDQFWIISNSVTSHRLLYARFFCYQDFCNQLSLVSDFSKLDIVYPSYKFQNDISECLICNASDYNDAKICEKTILCNSCEMTANQTVTDLYDYGDWSSNCFSVSDPQYFGQLFLQYEIDSKLLNTFARLSCLDKICTTFDFMRDFISKVTLLI